MSYKALPKTEIPDKEKGYVLVDLKPDELLQKLYQKYDCNGDRRISKF